MGDKPKSNPIKIGKMKKYSACDYKGNVYFTSDSGASWIMYGLKGTSKEFGNLPHEHFSLIKEGH